MNIALKSALLSAFVYPGAGHFFLKKYTLCTAYVCTFSVPLYLLFREIFSKTELVVKQIQNGEIPLDVTAISHALSHSITGVSAQELNIKVYVLMLLWILGIIDSYRLGLQIKSNIQRK